MSEVYPSSQEPVKPIFSSPPIFGIPLEVAQDRELSDSAILLFGEIYGLVRKYGICTALDMHFMERRGKRRSTIQAQLKELKLRGYISVKTVNSTKREILCTLSADGKNTGTCPENEIGTCLKNEIPSRSRYPENEIPTQLRYPEKRKMDATYPENKTGTCLENEIPLQLMYSENKKLDTTCPENETPTCPENGTHKNKTLKIKSLKKETLKTPEFLECSEVQKVFVPQISVEENEKVRSAVKLFSSHSKPVSLEDFEALFDRCAGRTECFDIAVLSAKQANERGNLGFPFSFIRSVIEKNLVLSDDFVNEALYKLRHPDQARQIEQKQREEAAKKAAYLARPAQQVQELLKSAVKNVNEKSAADGSGLSSLRTYERREVEEIAEVLAMKADRKTMQLTYSDQRRKSLVNEHLSQAFESWKLAQKEKPAKVQGSSPAMLAQALREKLRGTTYAQS